jgi:hypothetical protein
VHTDLVHKGLVHTDLAHKVLQQLVELGLLLDRQVQLSVVHKHLQQQKLASKE